MLVFLGYRTSIARYVAKQGIALICLCKTRHEGGGIAPCWGIAGMAEKVSRDRGYRSDTIALSRDMGPLSWECLRLFKKPFFRKLAKWCFRKHYKNRVFEGCLVLSNLTNWFTNCKLVCHKKCIVLTQLVLLLSNHYFCKAKVVVWQMTGFCALFFWGGGETLIGQKWCTLFSSQLKQNQKSKNHSGTTIFSAIVWLLLLSQHKPVLQQKPKKQNGHLGVSSLCKERFCLNTQLVMLEKTRFSASFWGLFDLVLLTLSFLFWPSVF